MALYICGSTLHGELGCGGIEEEQIFIPRQLEWSAASSVQSVSSGQSHTLILTKDGRVYTCGNNDSQQLGRQEDEEHPRKRPHLVEGLKNHVITKVCCGSAHSIAINEWGNVFTWGSNAFGQLGHDNSETNEPIPKLVKPLGTRQIVQIACGEFHNILLTNEGILYAFGLNNHGQCGIDTDKKKIWEPTEIKALAGVPIAFIACGHYHTFVVSKSGAVFGFGKNNHGQLGTGDGKTHNLPTQLKTLRNFGVRYVAAGEDFSAFLTKDGRVFTCGDGKLTGLNSKSSVILPQMVMELGSECTQISCGSRHTLTYVPSRKRLYAFGMNSSGQLGSKNTSNASVPQIVSQIWTCSDESNKENAANERRAYLAQAFAGGERSFVLTTDEVTDGRDFRFHSPKTQIECLTLEMSNQLVAIGSDETADMALMSSVELLFKSLACINASFLSTNSDRYCSPKDPCIDMVNAGLAFNNIANMEKMSLKTCILEGITLHIVKSLIDSPLDVEALRVYLILPLYHEFSNEKNYKVLHTPFGQAMLDLTKDHKTIVTQWLAIQSVSYFERCVNHFKHVVLYILQNFPDRHKSDFIIPYDRHLEIALEMVKWLFTINMNDRKEQISYEVFYIYNVELVIDVPNDYFSWLVDKTLAAAMQPAPRQRRHIYLCNYPFLYSAMAKKELLEMDQTIQMKNAVRSVQPVGPISTESILRTFLTHPDGPTAYLVITVTRDRIVNDTISELSKRKEYEYKRPLKIKIRNEEAEDEGGVRKEFFLLLMTELLDKKYGMFDEYEESRCIWFADHSFEDQSMYRMVGLACGLALYNFVIINVPFPLVLYKKLLDEPVGLDDLGEMQPTILNSMKSILEYAGDDFEETFDLTFQVRRKVFDVLEPVDLKPNGSNIRVTQENKQEFVDLYVDYMLNKSIKVQFEGFRKGFMQVCGGDVLKLFRSNELMSIIVGNADYDWDVFEDCAKYKNGYTEYDPTVELFWEVFHELSVEHKKHFLLFLTGSDRLPINGMEGVQMTIQPVSDDKHLPVAHTCFNILDLPRYQTKEKLKYKLLQALEHRKGFGLV